MGAELESLRKLEFLLVVTGLSHELQATESARIHKSSIILQNHS